ncbi:MAG TPA: DUF2092 domain-containing protein [Xanthomonadales bacterium]
MFERNSITPSWLKPGMLPTRSLVSMGVAACLAIGLTSANADEADAKRILKSMSDYMSEQKSFSFNYDSILEVVTPEGQVIGLASSGSLTFSRPDKIRATRSGGFVDVATNFDGKTLTILGKNLNKFTQVEIPGTVDHLIDELKNTYNRPLPAADLLLSNSYDELMQGVLDVKDLGSGVIGGVECDSLAFQTEEVDWQIWIAQGDQPYPCRYVITTKELTNGPQYSVQISNWQTGLDVAADDFTFKNTTEAEQVELESLKGMGDLPDHFVVTKGESQ